jgi:putative endonuclease
MIPLLRRLCGLSEAPVPLGQRGERLAADWLAKRGYKILERNVSFGDDEADIVVLDPDGRTIVVVEVKTRESDQPPPEASVGRTKQFRLSRCAAMLAKRARYRDRPFRFDVIAVVWPENAEPQVRHWPGAFESSF